MCLFRRHFCDNYARVKVKSACKIPGTAPESFYTKESFGTVPLLPVPRLREVVSAPLKFWALVPHYIGDRYV